MGKIQRYKEMTCLKCSDKYIDCRDYVFCTIEIRGLGYLGRKKELLEGSPKWCPKKSVSGKISHS